MKRAKYEVWTDEQTAILKELYCKGITSAAIAHKLGKTIESVDSKVFRMKGTGELKGKKRKKSIVKEIEKNEAVIKKEPAHKITKIPELPMSDEEIRRRHKNAIDPLEHILILSQLNCCSIDRIKAILKGEHDERTR